MLPKLLAAAKGVSRDLNNRPYNKEKDYWLLLTSVDVCQLRLLNLKAANVLGHLNEAIADSVLGTQIKSRQRRGLIGKYREKNTSSSLNYSKKRSRVISMACNVIYLPFICVGYVFHVS